MQEHATHFTRSRQRFTELLYSGPTAQASVEKIRAKGKTMLRMVPSMQPARTTSTGSSASSAGHDSEFEEFNRVSARDAVTLPRRRSTRRMQSPITELPDEDDRISANQSNSSPRAAYEVRSRHLIQQQPSTGTRTELRSKLKATPGIDQYAAPMKTSSVDSNPKFFLVEQVEWENDIIWDAPSEEEEGPRRAGIPSHHGGTMKEMLTQNKSIFPNSHFDIDQRDWLSNVIWDGEALTAQQRHPPLIIDTNDPHYINPDSIKPPASRPALLERPNVWDYARCL